MKASATKGKPIEGASEDNRDGREAPNAWDTVESISWRMVMSGETKGLDSIEMPFPWKGATLPEFIALEARGFRKFRARVEWNAGTVHSRVVEIHFWTDGTVRSHFKIK